MLIAAALVAGRLAITTRFFQRFGVPPATALSASVIDSLSELRLIGLDRVGPGLEVAESPQRTALEQSAAFRAYQRRLEDGRQFLSSRHMTRAAA